MSVAAQPSYARRLVAEALGTCILLMAIVGPGILAMKTSGNNVAISIMAGAATAFFVLAALITMFISISGAHFNPALTLMVAIQGDLKWGEVPGYIGAQILGGCVGTVLANLMFELPPIVLSTTARTGTGNWLGEFIATFGLLATIWAVARLKPEALAFCVGGYVFGAIWFTSSTCFANPAVTIARALTDTLCGIRPGDVPAYIVCQLIGAGAATALFAWLIPPQMAEHLDRVVTDEPAPEPIKRERTPSGPLAPLS